ncbi:DUF4097 family beta strand repeat-containing protein [Nocardiopsis ansamitocini]|uniref:DUF4097 domain-containing protein n=1 Tax=Nocardiopsis ansamitocini TaxID=1670832 RepID=A0A9W6P5Q8_9ACTN|nr:DUF4097 family beta strand repeat-containing protein [Nocardiopsis ansamitocini]GLU47548.1 hypothetical protein Nans01_18990 [Nocardiopsis ansamitocini]
MTFNGRGLYVSSSKVPRRQRLGWLALGAVIGLIALVFGLLNMLNGVSFTSETREDSYPASALLRIDADVVAAVSVSQTGGDRITVQRALVGAQGSGSFESVEQDDEKLELNVSCWRFPLFSTCEVDYVIGVPEGTDLDISTDRGRVDVTGVVGDVTVDTGSGDIALSQVRGSIDLESGAGDISAAGEGATAKAESDVGDVDLRSFRAAEVEGESDVGDVLLGTGFEKAEASTGVGEVTVWTDEEFRSLKAQSDVGDVDVRVPDAPYRVTGETGLGDRDIRVRPGGRGDASIRVETGTGSAVVRAD